MSRRLIGAAGALLAWLVAAGCGSSSTPAAKPAPGLSSPAGPTLASPAIEGVASPEAHPGPGPDSPFTSAGAHDQSRGCYDNGGRPRCATAAAPAICRRYSQGPDRVGGLAGRPAGIRGDRGRRVSPSARRRQGRGQGRDRRPGGRGSDQRGAARGSFVGLCERCRSHPDAPGLQHRELPWQSGRSERLSSFPFRIRSRRRLREPGPGGRPAQGRAARSGTKPLPDQGDRQDAAWRRAPCRGCGARVSAAARLDQGRRPTATGQVTRRRRCCEHRAGNDPPGRTGTPATARGSPLRRRAQAIDPEHNFEAPDGRPIRLVDNAQPPRELL